MHNASAGDAQPPSSSSNQQQPEETNAQPEVWSRVKKAVLGDKELDRFERAFEMHRRSCSRSSNAYNGLITQGETG